jgi:hypothetical protein
MEEQNFLGGENQGTTAFERRHPADLEIQNEIQNLIRQQRAGLSIGYALTKKSMEQFFDAGHQRPDFGDESY